MIAVVVLYRAICVIVDLFLAGLVLFAVGYVACAAYRAVRNRIRLRRCPLPRRPLPGLPVDGQPLCDDEDGEAEVFAALIYAYRAKPAPEPVYDLKRGDPA